MHFFDKSSKVLDETQWQQYKQACGHFDKRANVLGRNAFQSIIFIGQLRHTPVFLTCFPSIENTKLFDAVKNGFELTDWAGEFLSKTGKILMGKKCLPRTAFYYLLRQTRRYFANLNL